MKKAISGKKSIEKAEKLYQELQLLFSDFFAHVRHQNFEKAYEIRNKIVGKLKSRC